jgi:hypothetical protein
MVDTYSRSLNKRCKRSGIILIFYLFIVWIATRHGALNISEMNILQVRRKKKMNSGFVQTNNVRAKLLRDLGGVFPEEKTDEGI